jgi:NAD(P)-dependent dehydrogenase (short-subunit alcohol dehydrogenase family)
MKLQSTTAIVTGGSRGIGRTIALRLAHEGANIGILNRQKTLLGDKVAAEITSSGHHAVAVIQQIHGSSIPGMLNMIRLIVRIVLDRSRTDVVHVRKIRAFGQVAVGIEKRGTP